MGLVIEEMVDTPEPMKRGLAEIDLVPYQNALKAILVHPSNSKAIPVTVGEARGEGAASVRDRFQAALAKMSKTEQYDPSRVKLSFRNANPGQPKITRMYVKWEPLVVRSEPATSNGSTSAGTNGRA